MGSHQSNHVMRICKFIFFLHIAIILSTDANICKLFFRNSKERSCPNNDGDPGLAHHLRRFFGAFPWHAGIVLEPLLSIYGWSTANGTELFWESLGSAQAKLGHANNIEGQHVPIRVCWGPL